MFRMNHKEYKKNNNINVIAEKSNKDLKVDVISECEPVTCEPITCELVIEGKKKSFILNMINKEYMRLEKIRLEKDKLINLQDTCEKDKNMIYYRNLYIMEEDKINKQILELLQY